jgi:hypothetical protein
MRRFAGGLISYGVNTPSRAGGFPEYRHSMVVDPTPMNALKTSKRSGIFAKLRAVFRLRAPVGYEDETGFHLGRTSTHSETSHSFYHQNLNKFDQSNQDTGRDLLG